MGIEEDDEEEGKVAVDRFRNEAEIFLFLSCKLLSNYYKLCFKELHQSSLMSGFIFITEREKCRFSARNL